MAVTSAHILPARGNPLKILTSLLGLTMLLTLLSCTGTNPSRPQVATIPDQRVFSMQKQLATLDSKVAVLTESMEYQSLQMSWAQARMEVMEKQIEALEEPSISDYGEALPEDAP